MSKRHTHIPNGHDHTIPSDIPFRNNLIFYAPMHEQCCCDYVSNIAPEVDYINAYTKGSCIWDTNIGMWKLKTQQSPTSQATFAAALNYYGLELFSGIGTDNWYTNGLTLFMQIQKIATNENNYLNWVCIDNLHISQPHGDNPNTPIDGRVRFNMSRARFNNDIPTNTTSKVAITMAPVSNPGSDACTCKTYKDGTLHKTFTWNASISGPTNPDSFAVIQNSRNCSYGEYYIKDIRIYNRLLTSQEIAQL